VQWPNSIYLQNHLLVLGHLLLGCMLQGSPPRALHAYTPHPKSTLG